MKPAVAAHLPGMSNQQNRQPTGAPTGGQFATTAHTEPDVALSAELPFESSNEVVAARAALAAAVGIPADDVAVEVDTSDRCGSPRGSAWVEMSAKVPGDRLSQEVSIGFERGPEGGTSDARCDVGWDISPLPTLDYARDSTTTPYRPQRDAAADTLTQTVADTLDQARVQRSLNTNVNDQQYKARLADHYRNGRSWYDIFSMTAEVTGGQLTVVVEDRRSGSGGKKLRLDVARDGAVTGGTVETDFGSVNVTGRDLDEVCRRVDWELAFAQDRVSDASVADRARLESRFASILTGADL
jgi:hypothetical protein